MKYSIFFISLLFSYSLFGQDTNATWVSVSRLDVVNDSTYLTKNDSLGPYEPIMVDSGYFNHYGLILEFMDNQEVKFGGIGTEIKKGTYQLSNKMIYLKIDTLTLLARFNSKQLIIINQDSTNWQSSHLILEKLTPHSAIIPDRTMEKLIKKKYWKFLGDSLSNTYGLSLYFRDTSTLTINRISDRWRSKTTTGTYKLAKYKNDLFLYVFDKSSMDQYFFRFYDVKDHNYLATSYEQGWFEDSPTKHNIDVKRIPIPTNRQLKKIKEKLMGNWASYGQSFPFDPEISDFESIEDKYFKCTFLKDSFNIEYGGVLINGTNKTFKKVEYKGVWGIGETGNYIFLKTNDGYTKYLTLVELNQTDAIISMNTKSIDCDWVEMNRSIKLIKSW